MINITIKEFLDLYVRLPYEIQIYNNEDVELADLLYKGVGSPRYIPSELFEKKLRCFDIDYDGNIMLFVRENEND